MARAKAKVRAVDATSTANVSRASRASAATRARAKSRATGSSGKCNCNIGLMVVSWILMAVGLWALVGGFALQFASAAPSAVNVEVLGWYFAGVLVFSLGKMAKWSSCSHCNMHSR